MKLSIRPSLKQGLISSKTNLKSLKFGQDRFFGGSSNQPYITKEIPIGGTPIDSPDFLVRDPLNIIQNTADDVSRLTKMFFDFKSPNGLLFVAKQELLSRTAVKTQANTGLLNAGIYLPTSTLAQAAVSAEGLHLMKQGVNPIPGLPLSLPTYSDVINSIKDENNRLIDFYYTHQDVDTSSKEVNLYSYGGGPGSILGIGKTNIQFADQRTGINNPDGKNIIAKIYQTSGYTGADTSGNIGLNTVVQNTILGVSEFKTGLGSNNVNYKNLLGTSLNYFKFFSPKGTDDETLRDMIYINNGINDEGKLIVSYNVYNPDFTPNTKLANDKVSNNTKTLDQSQIYTLGDASRKGEALGDFREKLISNKLAVNGTPSSTTLSISPSYKRGEGKRIEERVGLGDPGNINEPTIIGEQTKNVLNYGVSASLMQALDKITAQPVTTDFANAFSNDLVKFRIKTWDNNQYMFFRAFIDSFSDSYNANWNEVKYVGRGESFYNYTGFGRKISLSFTVAAQSKAELIPMYTKLNYLASNLAPDYSTSGFMRSPIVNLTLGGYVYEQPGFITSLTYTIPEESPWEIAIPDGTYSNGAFEDTSVKELPHIIKVSSFEFTPIHNFLPRKNRKFPDQESKFIALTAGGETNYKDKYPVQPKGKFQV